jgi:uncharacterized Zn-finger protein
MSTKMYNFYRYPRNDIYALWEWLEALRPKCQQHAIQEIIKYRKLAKGDLWDRLMEDTTTGIRSPFNIDASAVLYRDGLDIYVQFFGVPSSLYEQEVKEFRLIDNHYQNSSDQPENVSDEEWERRYQVVERLLDKHDSGHADKCGLSYILMDKHDCMWIVDQVRKHTTVVCWLVDPPQFWLCTTCSPEPPDGNANHPRLMEIDMERMEETPCGTCGRVFRYGQWREQRKEPEGL